MEGVKSRGERSAHPVAAHLSCADEPIARLKAAYESACAHARTARKSTLLQGHIRAALAAVGDVQRALILAGLRANA